MSSLNKKFIKFTFLFLLLTEVLSFLAWKFSVLNLICFAAILLITLILSLKKLEYGLYILFAELFIGSFGYLFSYQGVSIRIGIFLIVIAVWLFRFLQSKNKKECINFKFNKNFILLVVVLIWAFVWGLIRRNNFGNVFLDFNNWLYWLVIFPATWVFYPSLRHTSETSPYKGEDKTSTPFQGGVALMKSEPGWLIKNILNILIASVILICLKTLVLFYLFSHNYAEIMGTIYRWVRDTRIGEITFINGNFYRIFIPSQIYSLFLFFILLVKSFKNKIISYLLLIICLTTIVLSFSRSYWVGLLVGLIFYFGFILVVQVMKPAPNKQIVLNFFKKFAKVLVIIIISLVIVSLIVVLPPKVKNQDLFALFKSRATQSEAASSSRLAQLKPLSLAIVKHPVIGSGFGTTVTYISDDPRVKGEITTHAFEWGYLDMILKFGLVGLIIYLILIFKIGKELFIKKENGILLALISLLVVNIFSPYLNHPLGIGLIIICLSFVIPTEVPIYRDEVEESLKHV